MSFAAYQTQLLTRDVTNLFAFIGYEGQDEPQLVSKRKNENVQSKKLTINLTNETYVKINANFILSSFLKVENAFNSNTSDSFQILSAAQKLQNN